MNLTKQMKKVGSRIYSGAKKTASDTGSYIKTKAIEAKEAGKKRAGEAKQEFLRKRAIETKAYKKEENIQLARRARQKAKARYSSKSSTQQGGSMMGNPFGNQSDKKKKGKEYRPFGL